MNISKTLYYQIIPHGKQTSYGLELELKEYSLVIQKPLSPNPDFMRVYGAEGKNKGETNPKRDLSQQQIADMPAKLANPDAIYWDKQNQTWLFTYPLDNTEEARVIFKQRGNRPLRLVSYSKVDLGKTKESVGEAIYAKK